MTRSEEQIRDMVRKGVASAADTPSIEITTRAVPAVTERVVREMGPTLEHLTNSEGWYRSRVAWGAILSAVGATASLLGYTFEPELQGRILEAIMLWVGVGGLVSGPLLTLYGRFVAKTPLGR